MSENPAKPSPRTYRARGIVDIGEQRLSDVPFALKEALRKTKGVLSAQLNAFSRKLVVEFDPSLISLDEIKEKLVKQSTRVKRSIIMNESRKKRTQAHRWQA